MYARYSGHCTTPVFAVPQAECALLLLKTEVSLLKRPVIEQVLWKFGTDDGMPIALRLKEAPPPPQLPTTARQRSWSRDSSRFLLCAARPTGLAAVLPMGVHERSKARSHRRGPTRGTVPRSQIQNASRPGIFVTSPTSRTDNVADREGT